MEKENGDERAKTMSSPERQRGEEKLGQTWWGGGWDSNDYTNICKTGLEDKCVTGYYESQTMCACGTAGRRRH